jgi:hypothetical protein
MSGDSSAAREHSAYVGWWAAAITLLVIFAACAGIWLIYHPL